MSAIVAANANVQQQRSPSEVDNPERPAGELYCRVPQDSGLNVRGVRNIPCETNPAKRAATDEYVGPDGSRYKQADLVHQDDKTWQSMLIPPGQ